jgi:phosphonate transport system permease protein
MVDAALISTIETSMRRRKIMALAVPALILVYLLYAAISFDVLGVASRARMDNARILLSDFWSYKVHVTRDNRSGRVTSSLDGDNRYAFDPDWVVTKGDITTIDLGGGAIVTYDPSGARMIVPGYGTVDIVSSGGKIGVTAPQPLPDWISVSDKRVAVTTPLGRFNYTKSKVETFRYFAGWEMFFFTFDSQFHGKSLHQLVDLALWEPRLEVGQSNLALMAGDFWSNRLWHHGEVVWALFETVLMAFLGTMSAAILALLLSFIAASNMMPFRALRFGMRRLFDFIRGVDALIWTIILARAFGPGPMTGALAIFLTDTGAFGKTFSEALENIDEKQVEGVRSTGANALQRARFGVIPQVMPVLMSQVLYAFESNTRSATVIGAIVGGGIGLLLTQAIQTQKDWEDVCYYLILIVLMVFILDWLSGLIRRKLIKG